ncbi:unnamed protein product [Caenorhabditis bovis]|uniref:SXP/RAL-2 family protein Ani s 5-like cation-binding domain-containing protein n=1 Tax=Caenorhabditis bovis TaxID=2654633 RepID=A0A8S1FC86_9PELO|nr:unnamed protein product [Caenorhabditis bovis]
MAFCIQFGVLLVILGLNVQQCASQQAFGSVSLAAIQRIIPHASNANVFALAKALNNNIGKFAVMRTAINQFFTQNKQGKPNPKTLSQYDNANYSRQKLIALVNNRQAIKQWWDVLTPGLTKLYNAATAQKYKNLYAYFDNREKNSYDYVLVYFTLCISMKEMDETKMDKLTDLVFDSMEAQYNKTPALAFLIYTEAWQKNHNQTYMKGNW